MNRRRLLAMLPLAPVAALLPTVTSTEATQIDTRPMFRRSDYVVVEHGGLDCVTCGRWHGPYYTVGHKRDHPAAFERQMALNSWSPEVLHPVPAGAIPVGSDFFASHCLLADGAGPHAHADDAFRWVD